MKPSLEYVELYKKECTTVKIMLLKTEISISSHVAVIYEGWNFNSGNYLFTTDTK